MKFASFIRILSKISFRKDIIKFKDLLSLEYQKYLSKNIQIQPAALQMLILAEDHRFYKHGGVDLRALFRAIIKTYVFKNKQGGSTIEQQLVRVITNKYDKSIQRKFKEIILASQVKDIISKDQVLHFYLGIAYFGFNKTGYNNALTKKSNISEIEIASIIARLKYPEPLITSTKKMERINNRTNYIYRKYIKYLS